VSLPVSRIEIEFNGPVVAFTIDFDGCVYKIGPSAVIPLAGRNNRDFLAVIGKMISREIPRKPTRLDFEFIKAWDGLVLGKYVGFIRRDFK
jgi:hypothetical protein